MENGVGNRTGQGSQNNRKEAKRSSFRERKDLALRWTYEGEGGGWQRWMFIFCRATTGQEEPDLETKRLRW